MKTVYALCDPSLEIRYVGVSDNVKRRVSDHRYDRRGAVGLWLKSLMEAGLRPRVIEFETVPEDLGAERESWWIQTLYAAGAQLLNQRGTENKKLVVYRLTPEAIRIIKDVAEEHSINKTKALELVLRFYREHGLKKGKK